MARSPDSEPDRLLTEIAGLDRERCLARLRAVQRPQLDFTEQFLAQQSLESLRHLLAAAELQARKNR
jgi:hypothetical protein